MLKTFRIPYLSPKNLSPQNHISCDDNIHFFLINLSLGKINLSLGKTLTGGKMASPEHRIMLEAKVQSTIEPKNKPKRHHVCLRPAGTTTKHIIGTFTL